MATLQQTVSQGQATIAAEPRVGESLLNRFIKLLCSVRFGVALLVILGLLCFLGMVIMQQNVEGFARYFEQLTPAQRMVYGYLGLFDIYHVWYFNALLAVLSLNIILSSIDRFPKTWLFVSRPNLTVPVRWLREQKNTAEGSMESTPEKAAERIAAAMKQEGWKKVRTTEKGGKTFVFGESGLWNRFGAYFVHVGLLTIFVGGFMTAQMGSTGSLPVAPGVTGDLMYETVVDLDQAKQETKRLPFQVTGVDLQQKLIKKDESISAMNTIDWITRFTITDEYGTTEAVAQMNRPFDYRGYRFFQSSFIPVGRARSITLSAVPADGGPPQQVTIPRDGVATLADGTQVKFSAFRGNFRMGQEDPDEDTSDYQNPAAVLQVAKAGGQAETAYAFGAGVGKIPVASKVVGGYTFKLDDFEKVADQHILSVQRDPGATVVYVGFLLLCVTLVAVFFFQHQRAWAAIEDGGNGIVNITFGAHSNRNLSSFDDRFKRFVARLSQPATTAAE